jgi:hypothetical protein
MSLTPDTAPDQPAPRWLLALLGVSVGVLLIGASLVWWQRGATIVLDMAEFFCL